jgi:hypothetical protein
MLQHGTRLALVFDSSAARQQDRRREPVGKFPLQGLNIHGLSICGELRIQNNSERVVVHQIDVHVRMRHVREVFLFQLQVCCRPSILSLQDPEISS